MLTTPFNVRYVHKISQTCKCGHPQSGHASDPGIGKFLKWGEGKCRSSATCDCLAFEAESQIFWLDLSGRLEAKDLAKKLRDAHILCKGGKLREMRKDKDKIVAFPAASVWHAIIITPIELVPHYTESATVYGPDIMIKPRESFRYEAVRGYTSFVLAFENDRAVGCVDTRDLGFETAREWLAAKEVIS